MLLYVMTDNNNNGVYTLEKPIRLKNAGSILKPIHFNLYPFPSLTYQWKQIGALSSFWRIRRIKRLSLWIMIINVLYGEILESI